MTRLEMVEQLREKAGVSYDAARDALEKNNWDMLDALIALKRDSDIKNTAAQKRAESTADEGRDERVRAVAGNVGEKVSTGVRCILTLLSKGENLRVEILYRDRLIGSVSVTVLVLLLLFCWYIPIGLGILGFIAGYRFRFSNKTAAGKVMNTLGVRLKEEADKEYELSASRRSEE